MVAWGGSAFPYGQTNIPAGAQSGVKSIAAGAFHSVALKTDGSVVAWGLNTSGQTTVPTEAQNGVIAIAAGGNSTVALKSDGSVVVWGDNSQGQAQVPVLAQSEITAIASGGQHTVAVSGNSIGLQLKHSQDKVVVTWPIGAFGYQLQSAPSLSPPVVWTDSTNEPVVIGAEFTVTNSGLDKGQFFPLRIP